MINSISNINSTEQRSPKSSFQKRYELHQVKDLIRDVKIEEMRRQKIAEEDKNEEGKQVGGVSANRQANMIGGLDGVEESASDLNKIYVELGGEYNPGNN